MLYLVPTPIGNLEDITLRAIRILQESDLILAEDTRVAGRLFKKFDISTPFESFHAHNEHKKLDSIVERLKSGMTIALISDAGTPGISDPGFILVRECVRNELALSCLPGPAALIPAMVMSGIPCDKFHFEGFLPHKKGKRTRVEYLVNLENPFILYESPHRVVKTLQLISELAGESRQVAVSREISKLHEENLRGEIHSIINILQTRNSIKGEIVIVVEGRN